jgi:hypothetical protein
VRRSGTGRIGIGEARVLDDEGAVRLGSAATHRSCLHEHSGLARASCRRQAGGLAATNLVPARRRASPDSRRFFRRRPGLDRGWRFCRFHWVPHIVGWPRLLVREAARFWLVLGRFGPNLDPSSSVLQRPPIVWVSSSDQVTRRGHPWNPWCSSLCQGSTSPGCPRRSSRYGVEHRRAVRIHLTRTPATGHRARSRRPPRRLCLHRGRHAAVGVDFQHCDGQSLDGAGPSAARQ